MLKECKCLDKDEKELLIKAINERIWNIERKFERKFHKLKPDSYLSKELRNYYSLKKEIEQKPDC